jgi:hypothetical protein
LQQFLGKFLLRRTIALLPHQNIFLGPFAGHRTHGRTREFVRPANHLLARRDTRRSILLVRRRSSFSRQAVIWCDLSSNCHRKECRKLVR